MDAYRQRPAGESSTQAEGMNCLNCLVEVPPSEAKFFEGVFVCPVCYERAERFYQRGKKELQQLLTMQKEAIRIALIERQLHFGADQDKDTSKTDLLRAIVQLEEVRRDTLNRAGRVDPVHKPVAGPIPSTGLLPGGHPLGGKRKG